MREKVQKTTMSVPEMRELLGLKKTESYWLLKKNLFEVVMINNQLRIVMDSFEKWYANQTHYHKANGEIPGRAVIAKSYSISDCAEMLNVSTDQIYYIIKRNNIETFTVSNQKRIRKKTFDRWYKSQEHYRNQEDREHDRELEESSMMIAEFGRLLCLGRTDAYVLSKRLGDQLEWVQVAGCRRITKESFERWYASQTKYVKFTDLPAREQWRLMQEDYNRLSKMRMPKLSIPDDRKVYSMHDAAVILMVPEKEVYSMLRSGKLAGKKVGNTWFVTRDALINWMDANEGSLTTENTMEEEE